MNDIKQRRLTELRLESHPELYVGQFTPFYFCPRSVMLFLIYKANHPNLTYKGGQGSIVHLEADLRDAVQWASEKGRRWAFTLSNAGAKYFEDRSDLSRLKEINWDAVHAQKWDGGLKEGKQAEFLIERYFPWHLVERIGYLHNSVVNPSGVLPKIIDALKGASHRPVVEKCNHWYY